MILRSIEAERFRNLGGKIIWGDTLNIIHGNNGQGKTNWLEALHVLAHTKSFRTSHLQEAVRFGEREAFVRGRIECEGLARDLQVALNGSAKQLLVNGKRETLARYSAQLYAVAFTADELDVVRGVPEARRRFLDHGVIALRPAYAQTLSDYKRVIKQKNRLLQDASEGPWSVEQVVEMIAPWNEQLAALATLIHRERVDYVNRLNECFDHSLFKDHISVRYVSSFEGKGDLDDYESMIRDRLRLRLPAEIGAGMSLIGPHRDELEITLKGRDLRAFGSSGQQRSALITLDLAAISVYHSKHQDYPLFLIDDVDAELDGNRIGSLLEYLEGRTQTFITTSKKSHFVSHNSRVEYYEISAGTVVTERCLASRVGVGE